MPKTVASGSQSFYFACACMEPGEGRLFKCRKRRDMWKRLHKSKCEFGDCEDIKLKSIGDPDFDGLSGITEYTLRDRVKKWDASLD